MWPKGSGKFACFTAGLSVACYIGTDQGDKLAQCMASYKGEWAPGFIPRPLPGREGLSGPQAGFKMYIVYAGQTSAINPDVANWGLMVPYGAPYVDKNGNHQYDPDIDEPGMQNASETIFMCLTDAILSQRNPGEGFGGGINYPYLYAEIHFTAWAYQSTGVEDMQFVNWVVINKGDSAWKKTFFSVVVDPDLGNAADDYIGCDRSINLGYCYNGDNDDEGGSQTYGVAPPAFGMDYFKSPIIKGTPNDTLGLTSFTFFTNTGSGGIACETDPNGEPYPAYLNMQGFKKDSTEFWDPTTNPPSRSKYTYPGDPESNIGWTELRGSYQNCGRDSSNSVLVQPNPKGDRRFIFSSGRSNFTVFPGDTQNIVLAQFVARGNSNLNSVTKLRFVGRAAKTIYDNNFKVITPIPKPVVNGSYNPTINGQCNLTLNWGSESESYRFWDSVFHMANDSNIYKFQGYEIYEVNKSLITNALSLPNFTKPETIDPNYIKLIAIYDLKDTIGNVYDYYQTAEGVYARFPAVPPYKLTPSVTGFPNSGVSRSLTLTTTNFAQNYGGTTGFIYGQDYYFIVVAYAVSTAPIIIDSLGSPSRLKFGFKVLRSALEVSKTKNVFRPIAPPAGTVFTMKNGDTLNLMNPIKDLGCAPTIRNQNLVLSATYRLVFNPDTTYNIIRMLSGNNYFDTLFKNVKLSSTKPTGDDDSRTADGIFFNTQKIRYTASSGNIGVLKDPTLRTDSIQTRKYGWEYIPSGNNPFYGAKDSITGALAVWQSRSMSITYPTSSTWNKVPSGLKVEKLRTIKIEFKGYGNGQQAYRFCAKTHLPPADPSFAQYIVNPSSNPSEYRYQDKREVPFKVWEIDPYDSSAAPRQLNVAFLETNSPIPLGKVDGKFEPNSDSTGGYEFLFIFNSTYQDPVWDANYTNLTYSPLGLYFTNKYDIMYIWGPASKPGASFQNGDVMYIYPYYATRPYYADNIPFVYEFTTVAPTFGNSQVAIDQNAMEKIRVVPNPYYGYSTLDRTSVDRFVTFRNLPLECTIKIYTLNGDLINTIIKTKGTTPTTSSTAEWNLQNQDKVPVASGIYIALIDAPGIGTKVFKIVIFTAQERINF
jgi:hypothetical protein